MREWCMKEGVSLLALALQFCMKEKRIHGNPLGNLNIEQLEMNALAVSEPLPDEVFVKFAEQKL